MKPLEALLLLTAILQALPLSLLLLIHLSFKIPKSLSEVYPSLYVSSFSAPQPLPTRVFSVVHGNLGNTANSRQEHSAPPVWCFHPCSCLVCHRVYLLRWELSSPGSVVFCLQNTNLGKVSDLAEPKGWQRCTLWFTLPPTPWSQPWSSRISGLFLSGVWKLLIEPGAGVVTSPQRMANLRVHHKTDSNVWFFHLPLCNADILFGSWVSLEEKNVLNYFNEVCWNFNNKIRFISLFPNLFKYI